MIIQHILKGKGDVSKVGLTIWNTPLFLASFHL